MSGKETANIHWSREEIIQLIDLYRQHPCLWNVKSDMYKDRAERVAALTAIAAELRKTCVAITTGDIKRKIETLQNQHRREMQLVENSRKSGAGVDDIYIPRLWCFNDLSFLNDGGIIRPSLSNIDNATNDTAEEEHSDHEIEEGDETENAKPSTSQQERPRKRLSKSDQILDTVARKLDESVNTDISGMDNFGKYVTRRILVMDQRTSIITRKIINDVLFESEKGNLNSSSRVVTTNQGPVPLPMPSNNSVYSYCSNSSSNTNDSGMSQYFSNFQP
ncbi:uncharacterized protein LOC135198998 [Macrobrachium nipponense]|uniref:uncharacterized protein LOC135198998 n=1 Tax=Macrobrachium nipponense TaxID=159736 RepID=UPI0030C8236B